ncbi:hypothetical protein FZEAL_2137 [Fusarium zealandicum]|uniref:BZIP domain-containing protein n=1 Tax=Fusarium zealandicum TaxID=1053134 RepID=A0A8H4URL1_9HYPO|nr:hypothetical protein FZEAL_2137 [Fusarium zealandicum]
MATPNTKEKRSFSAFLKRTLRRGNKSDESEYSTPQQRGKGSRGGEGLNGESPNTSSATSPQNPRKNLSASEKAKLRRAQVRKAQIQHRQRKAEHVKQMEIDVTHFREMISLTEFESDELRKENDEMLAMLLAKGITIPKCKSQCSIRPTITRQQPGDDSWIDETLGAELLTDDTAMLQNEEDMFADVNVDDIIVTLKKDDSMETPVFSIRSNSTRSNTTSPPVTGGDADLSSEEEQMAVNFILSLEHICWDHFFLGDFPSHAHLSDNKAKGHTLMASSICMAHAPQDVFHGRKLMTSCHDPRALGTDPYVPPAFYEWPSPRITLASLHGLARSLNPGDKELTPVQAWFELAGRFDRSVLLNAKTLETLSKELNGVVKCLEFGAVMEREAFESVVGRVLGESLEDTMAGTFLDEPMGQHTQDPAQPVGYAWA